MYNYTFRFHNYDMNSSKRRLIITELIGLLFSLAMSYILHYSYQWSGENIIVAAFSAANESVWEHSKLLFFPYLFYSFIACLLLKSYGIKRVICAKAVPLIFAIPLMLVMYYTYTGIAGFNSTWVDICISIIIIILMYIYSYRRILKGCDYNGLGAYLITVALILFLLIFFTYYPFNAAMFMDTTDMSYGIY